MIASAIESTVWCGVVLGGVSYGRFIFTTDTLTQLPLMQIKNPDRNTRTSIANTHASVSSYHHMRHLTTLAPSYRILMVDIGFMTEQ